MPGCRISACGPGAQEGTAEPGSPPPPPRELVSSPQPPPPSPTLTPTPASVSAPADSAPAWAGSAEGQELQRWRQGANGGAGATAPAGGAAAAGAAGGRALELAEARRRLLEVEGRRRLVSELESRVLQLHRVFLAAELRLAHRAESLGRLSGGVAFAKNGFARDGARLQPLTGPKRAEWQGHMPALDRTRSQACVCLPHGVSFLPRGRG
uniref:TMF1 regulated nuclear protein 1 n=1 Tax=Mustela putorius furo TaxID=9669 RepID=M3YW38_MUSPF